MSQASCGCKKLSPTGIGAGGEAGQRPDRYLSFKDIDCDGNARRLMAIVEQHWQQGGCNDAFVSYFQKKRAGGSGHRPDDLFLIHSNINQLREFLERCGDESALALLFQIEEECC